jgi:hypothetical protein
VKLNFSKIKVKLPPGRQPTSNSTPKPRPGAGRRAKKPLRIALLALINIELMHELVMVGDILEAGKTNYRWFSIDQARYDLNLSTRPVAVPGGIDKLAVAVQLDGNLKQDPYNLIISQLNLGIIKPLIRLN